MWTLLACSQTSSWVAVPGPRKRRPRDVAGTQSAWTKEGVKERMRVLSKDKNRLDQLAGSHLLHFIIVLLGKRRSYTASQIPKTAWKQIPVTASRLHAPPLPQPGSCAASSDPPLARRSGRRRLSSRPGRWLLSRRQGCQQQSQTWVL